MKTHLTLLQGGFGECDPSLDINHQTPALYVTLLLLCFRYKREEDSLPNIAPYDSAVSICLLS